MDSVSPNSAPGAVGQAYRLARTGAGLESPVTLTFQLDANAPAIDALTVAYQDGSGFWLRAPGVVRDAVAGTVSVATMHFSDWSVVAGSTARDLQGTFTATSTLGYSVSASGIVTLNYAGEDAEETYYLQGGTITLGDAVVVAGSTCQVDVPTQALVTNIVEIPKAPVEFWWGYSALWTMTCSDGASRTTDIAFDTFGIDHIGCARAYDIDPLLSQNPTIAADLVKGAYTIDCGAPGKVTTRWSFCANPPCP